jgi:hypothetical protein
MRPTTPAPSSPRRDPFFLEPDARQVRHGDGDEARGHLGEIDIGIANRRRDRLCDFSDVTMRTVMVFFQMMAGINCSSLRGAIATKQSILPHMTQ